MTGVCCSRLRPWASTRKAVTVHSQRLIGRCPAAAAGLLRSSIRLGCTRWRSSDFLVARLVRSRVATCYIPNLTTMRRTAVRALKGSNTPSNLPRSVSRSFATVRDPQQKVQILGTPPPKPAHAHLTIGPCRTRRNQRTPKRRPCGYRVTTWTLLGCWRLRRRRIEI